MNLLDKQKARARKKRLTPDSNKPVESTDTRTVVEPYKITLFEEIAYIETTSGDEGYCSLSTPQTRADNETEMQLDSTKPEATPTARTGVAKTTAGLTKLSEEAGKQYCPDILVHGVEGGRLKRKYIGYEVPCFAVVTIYSSSGNNDFNVSIWFTRNPDDNIVHKVDVTGDPISKDLEEWFVDLASPMGKLILTSAEICDPPYSEGGVE